MGQKILIGGVEIDLKRTYEFDEKTDEPVGFSFLVDKLGEIEAERMTYEVLKGVFNTAKNVLNGSFKHVLTSTATADRTQTLQDKNGVVALTSDIPLVRSFDVRSLNIETEDILGDDWNTNEMVYTKDEYSDISEVLIYVRDIGSNDNICKANIVVNGLDLYSVAAGFSLTTGFNVIPVDQNLTVSTGDKIQLAIRTATGVSDCKEGFMQVKFE